MRRSEYERWRRERLWRPSQVEGLEVVAVEGVGTWLVEGVEETGTVAGLVPARYEAFARVLFPFVDEVGTDDATVGQVGVSWRESARRHGRQWHRLMEADLVGADEAAWGGLPETGEAALEVILRQHTSSSDSFCLLWDGWGDLDEDAFPAESAVHVHATRYYALRGPIQAWREMRDPSYWWPEDQAWCYHVSIDAHDSNCAYLGASRRCIDELLRSEALEVIEVKPDDPAVAGMDRLNRPA